MLVNINFPGQLQWRSHEHAGAQDAFGEVVDVNTLSDSRTKDARAFRWFPPSEEINRDGYNWMQQQRNWTPVGSFHINDASLYHYMHDKVNAFAVWQDHSIRTPPWFEFSGKNDFYESLTFELPFLLRLNNSVAGFDSWLVREGAQVEPCLDAVLACRDRHIAAGRGINTSVFCSKFIDTQWPEHKLNVSYRITVAGGKVVTGYARVSDPGDWVAVTNKFHSGIADSWLFFNKRCHEIMSKHADLLVMAVESVGLNHQGLDVIEEPSTGNLYFLETQTTYDAGFIGAGPYTPPYYNPYNPELVKFIKENYSLLEREIPLYVHAWLDKREHFRQCYKNLADQMNSKQTTT